MARNDLPSPNAPNFPQRLREAVMTYLGRTGDPLDRGITLRDLIEGGIARLRDGYTAGHAAATGGALPIAPEVQAEEPDLTPPPTPTGFTASAAISHVFIEHDAPLYTQGHGHLRTRVYGKIVAPGDPLPVFADAVEITQFTGTVHAHPSNPSTTWRLWIKWESQDGVLSVAPAGGTNGLAVGTSTIRGVDLGPLIVAAGNLAAGAVELSKFGQGLEPMTVVSTLPATKVTSSIFNTADSKLYRWNGTAYVATVPTSDLAGTVADAQIAGLAASKVTGQLSDSQLAAISAAKVSGQLTNAQLQDIAASKVTGQLTNAQIGDVAAAKVTGQLSNAQIADVSASKLTGQIAETQIANDAISTPKLAAGAITTAKLAAGAVTADTIGANAITAAKIDAGAVTAAKLAAGAVTADAIAANAITSAKIESGAITTAKLAAGAVTASEIAAGAVTAGKIAANAVTAAEIAADAITAGKIQAGAVGANQIAASAIAVGTAAIQDGAIVNAMIANLAVDNAKIANVSVAKLTGAEMQVGAFIQSTSFSSGPGGSGFRLDAAGNAELNNATVRGTVFATDGQFVGEVIAQAPNGNKARMWSGDFEIYKQVPSVGLVLYKALSRVESGVGANNVQVTIPGYFLNQPRVIVSPANIRLYDNTYANQAQALQCEAQGITESAPGSMVWRFTPVATLNLGANSGQTVLNQSSGQVSTGWTSSQYTTPANTTTITPSVNLASSRGTGTSGGYYRRTARWRVQYLNGGAWVDGSWTAVDLPSSVSASASSTATFTFPSSGTWTFRIQFEAYDTGGTFTTTVEYEYATDTVTRSDAQTIQAQVAFNSSNSASASINYVPTYSLPAGWSLTGINFSYVYSYSVSRSGSFATAEVAQTPYSGGLSIVAPPNSSGSNLTRSRSASSNTLNFSTTASRSFGSESATASLTLHSVTGVYSRSRPLTNSTTAANSFSLASYTYQLTAAQVLATGSLNWIAIGE